ncbi:MAG: sulfatase-like hydrolase/transferase [Planctomycetes bacterium]|nr:sulfatase-like hydrolase/transferase [Planctomycetota bacterium]
MSPPNQKTPITTILIAIAFTPFVLFLSTANKFFLYNQEEFYHNLSIYIPFLSLFVFLYFLGAVAICLYRKHVVFRITSIFYLCFGYYYLFYYNIVHFGLVKSWPPILTVLFIFFIVVVFLLGTYIKHLQRMLSIVCVSAILVFAVEVWNFYNLYTGGSFFDIKTNYSTKENISSNPAEKPNIYHILFDGYQSDVFNLLADDPKFKKQLKGFTWYKEFRTTYQYTRDILPALFQGKRYDPNDSYKSWRFEGAEHSFVHQLKLDGYKINSYYANYFPEYSDVEVKTPTGLHIQDNNLIKQFFEIWLKEYFPKIHLAVKNRTDPAHLLDKIFPSIAYSGNESFAGTFLFEMFLRDEAKRDKYNNYTYVYMLLPHQPFLVDRNCNYCPRESISKSEVFSVYTEQAKCANKLLLKFLKNLKAQNRFDESLIIVQSDHGWNFRKNDAGEFVSVDGPNNGKEDADIAPKYIEARSAALLLVKLPRSNGDYNVSELNVNILNIAPTILDVEGADLSMYPGMSLKNKNCGLENSKDFYYGNYIPDQLWPESFSRFKYHEGEWIYTEEVPVDW